MIPKSTSYLNILRFKKMGSRNAENNDDVDRHITAIDTLATLIDSKKKNQCKATIIPAPIRGNMLFFFILCNCFFIKTNMNKTIKANSILYQTRYEDSREINLPSIPVNPSQRSTVSDRWSKAKNPSRILLGFGVFF